MRKLKLLLTAAALLLGGGISTWAQTWTGNVPAEGTFFLYNVGAEKFINNGDPAEQWGTNAYLQTGFGLDIQFESNNGAYNLRTRIDNGNNNMYLGTSTWCDGSATPWTFEAVDDQTNTYTIKNGEKYLIANDALNDLAYGALTNDNKSWWKLVSLDDFKAAMQAKTYSVTDPMDVSVFIQGRSFARNDLRNSTWVTTHDGGNWTWIGGKQNKYYGNEAYNNTFDVHQEITGLPEGTYEVRCSGFGTGGTTYIYGNNTSKALQSDNATDRGTDMEAKWIAIHEDNAFAGQSTGTFTVGDGNLTVGVKRETKGNWAIWDEFRLYYYGLDLSEFKATLEAAVEAAEAVNGTIPTAAYNTLATVVTENNKTYTTAADYTAASNAIVEATNTAKTLQANYTRYNNIKAAILAINPDIDLTTANAQVEEATTANDINAAVLTARNSLTSYISSVSLKDGQTFDLTDALIDNAAPGISGSTDYWTNSETPGLQYQLYEFYKNPGATTKQTLAASLPAGNYKLSVVAFTRTNYEAKLSAGEANTNIATVSNNTVNNRDQGNQWISEGNGVTDLVFNLSEATTNLEIGLTAYDSDNDNWMCWRSFRLVYGDVFEPYTLVEGKMNATVAHAQTTADNNFKSSPSPTTYMAVLNAIIAAQASKDAYAKITSAISKIDEAIAAATTATASTGDYDAIKLAYTNATIADNEIMTNVIAAYDAVIPVIKSQTVESGDFTLAIRNQSFEYGDMTGWSAASSSDTGVREASNPTYAATGSDGYYLFNTWWQGVPLMQTVSDLPNGQYTLTASVASDGATIYLMANGEHNEGTETGGTYPDKDVLQDATITFLVKNGNAIIGVVGGADGEAGVHKDYVEEGYWWYKADNFRLVKNRDLTQEEAAVAPTAIALKVGDDVVTEVALNATNNTVTLTPAYTPDNATPGYIAWESSDETVATVANGVVTAVLPGTTTITATSTLDKNIKATATVTVTYPESEVPATYYENNGATRTVYTLGENIIKNGSFEYPNPVYGWTTGTGSVNAMSTDYFDVPTEGAANGNQYLQAKASDGGAKPNSINTSWPLEDGKTYIFSYKIKANKQCTTNLDYIGTSLSNTKGSENGNKKFETPAYGTEWQTVTYAFTNTDNYKWLVFNARWMANAQSFDNVYLCEAAYTLEGNVDYATAAIPTANIGTDAFQYSQNAIDAANALVQGTATVEEVQAAYDAVTTLNAPAEGKLYNVVNISEGYDHNGKAVTFKSASDADLSGNTTSFGYNEAPGSIYPQGFKFTAVGGTKNGYKLSYTRADGNEVYVGTGSSTGLASNNDQIRPTTDASKAVTIQVVATSTENVWNLYNTLASKNIGANGKSDQGFYTVASYNSMKIQEAVENEVTLNIKAANQYGTLILPFNAEVPAGITAYSVAETVGNKLTLVEEDAFVANTPYLVFAESGANEMLSGLGSAYTDATYTQGLFTGVYAATTAPVGSYVLQNKNEEKLGFYKVADGDGKQPTVGANRAYLTVSAAEARDAFFFGDDQTTAIQAVKALTEGNAEIYDVNGVRQNTLVKGMNILKMSDGSIRKVMVK